MHKPFHTLIAALAACTGLDSLKASQDDSCQLLFDGLPLTIEYLSESDSVLFFSALGGLPRDNREDFCLKLLEANHFFSGTAGGTLSVHRNYEIVALHMVVSMQLLDVAQFMQTIESYMNTAERWAKACEQVDDVRPVIAHGCPVGSGWQPV